MNTTLDAGCPVMSPAIAAAGSAQQLVTALVAGIACQKLAWKLGAPLALHSSTSSAPALDVLACILEHRRLKQEHAQATPQLQDHVVERQ